MAFDTHGADGKPWVGFDLDGTLATYDHWRGIQHIGEPVKPMCDLIKKMHNEGKAVKIVTARVAPKDGDGKEAAVARALIAKWCRENLGFVPPITHEKDSLMETLYDDRVKAVEQNTGKVLNMAKFKVGDKVYFYGRPATVKQVIREPDADYILDVQGDEFYAEDEEVTSRNSRACNSTNPIVRKALNSTALNFSPGDKVSIVDTDIRYGGDKGEVVRKDGFRYVVRLTSRQDKPEVTLQPNQLKAANAEDAQGHEHGSDGKFASKGGGSDDGDSYEDPKTKRMKERLAKMREKNEALRKDNEQRRAALAGKKAELEKMRAEVMKANVDKWKAAQKSKNAVVEKAINAVAKNADIPGRFTSSELSTLKSAVSKMKGAQFSQYPDRMREKLVIRGPNYTEISVEKSEWEGQPVQYSVRGQGARSAFKGKYVSSIKEAATVVKRMVSTAMKQDPYSFGLSDFYD